MDTASFEFRQFGSPAGEPHVYVVERELAFPNGFNLVGARLIAISYTGGGWSVLLQSVAEAEPEERISTHHLQAFYEDLEWIAREQPLVLLVRGADILLRDVGMSLLSAAAHWEAFVRHGSSLTPMYLVLETPAEAINSGWLAEPTVR